MWFFGWILVTDESEEDDSNIDTGLLFEVGEQWLQDASRGGDESSAVKWEAVENIEKESGGGFWCWLTGR